MSLPPAVRYRYRGDRFSDPALRERECRPLRRADGKCVTGRTNMLVDFGGGPVVVLRRLLRVLEREGPPVNVV